jgi:hypothetical protein
MTLEKIKADLIKNNATLKSGNEETGYQELTGAEYDAVIDEWAQVIYSRELLEQEKAQKASARESLLERLGITEEEAKLLLG